MCHSYFSWSLYFQGTNLPAQVVLSWSHKTDLRSRFLVPFQFVKRHRDTSRKSRFPQSHQQDFYICFLCVPPLAVIGLFTWSMGILHIPVLGLALRCHFFCSEPIPDLLGIRRIARGFPQLFSSVSLAVSVTQNDYFETSVPLLLTTSLLFPESGGK